MSKRLLHTPEGVKDIYGTEFAKKQALENKLLRLIETYGYEGIQTPSFEYFDVFSKEIGTTPSKELFKFFDRENETLVLRPDFTPSIARCASKYFMDEVNPIRFCYLGNTFINTTANHMGKLNEVTQFGVELINDDSVEADAEMISIVVESLKAAGLEKFQISIGEVEYFKGLCQEAGLDEETEYNLRSFISGKNYFAAQELIMESGVLDPYQSILLRVADMFGNMESLDEAKKLVTNKRSLDAIDRLERLYDTLKLYDAAQYVSFDLGMLSKYNYYTGVIFKAYTLGIGNAVVTGGRYDKLLGRFGKEAPAIGFAIVVDELMEALSAQNIAIEVQAQKQKVFYDRSNSQDYAEKLALVRKLREQGENVELLPR